MFDVKDIEEFIIKESEEIKVYIAFSIVVFLLGMLMLYFGFTNNAIEDIGKIGGSIVTTIVFIPITRVLYIRKRIFAFKIAIKKLKSQLNDEDRKKLEDALWKNITCILENGNTWFNFSK